MSRMVIVYMDSQGIARYTGMSVELKTAMETWLAFTSFKQIAVQLKGAVSQFKTNYYVIGYYNNANVLFDFIGLDDEGFKRVTGSPPLTEEQWLDVDRRYREAAGLKPLPAQKTLTPTTGDEHGPEPAN